MTITGIRILPPLAIGRLGSADEPLDNYVVLPAAEGELGYRPIEQADTLILDTATGEISGTRPAAPHPPAFKSNGRIRPVAPFLEVFAETGAGELVPLTTGLLAQAGLAVQWRVEAGNYKILRRTGQAEDRIQADSGWFSDHQRRRLDGACGNFLAGKTLPLGWVQFVKPNAAFPEIRLRFTPAPGLVYGSTPPTIPIVVDKPIAEGGISSEVTIPPERILYDSARGTWHGYRDSDPTRNTLGQGLYASYGQTPFFNYYENPQQSRGYFDDVCDGIATVELVDGDGQPRFAARARFCSSPPAFAPDSDFVRTIADDLEQVIEGPAVDAGAVTPAQAADIIRRAYETVRFMNVPFFNGNTLKLDRPDAVQPDVMSINDYDDLERALQPVFDDPSVDTLQVAQMHDGFYQAVLAGQYGDYFASRLRRPDGVGDLGDAGRALMPALMSGADGRHLALTWRQIDTIVQAADKAAAPTAPAAPALTPRNLTAQLTYPARGNPANAGAASAIGNCCPGLEFDFRSVWRRVFQGITLVEHTNYVVQADPGFEHLLNHRLLCVDGRPVAVPGTGPRKIGGPDEALTTEDNPEGAVCLEWSNALAHALQKQGQAVTCRFTARPAPSATFASDCGADDPDAVTVQLTVRRFFEDDTAFISRDLAAPGELTQGLCSPWQNDFRECVCYYWASSRPDYVNVEPTEDGSRGDNWMTKARSGQFVEDDYIDPRLIGYRELFENWEALLRFQIGGRDAE